MNECFTCSWILRYSNTRCLVKKLKTWWRGPLFQKERQVKTQDDGVVPKNTQPSNFNMPCSPPVLYFFTEIISVYRPLMTCQETCTVSHPNPLLPHSLSASQEADQFELLSDFVHEHVHFVRNKHHEAIKFHSSLYNLIAERMGLDINLHCSHILLKGIFSQHKLTYSKLKSN